MNEGSAPHGGHVYLIGMMGAGKSSVGRALARRLGRAFVDADAMLEAELGASIRDVFSRLGEAVFRARERELVAALAGGGPPLVIALGGGAVLDDASRRRVRASGTVIWLQAPVEVLCERTAHPQTRPLLAGLDAAAGTERLRALLEQRAPVYAEAAHLAISSAEHGPATIAAQIAARLAGPVHIPVPLRPEAAGDDAASSYDVIVETGGLDRLGEHLCTAGVAPDGCVLVSCERVAPLYGERTRRALVAAGFRPVFETLPSGERAKRLATVERLCARFARARLDRGGVVIALGGGALTDVVGLAAALYRRGTPWVACPTTLLGMVDAAIGGKTAVNLGRTKNLIGAFHQPRCVLADPLALHTLPVRELRSGLGEVLKYALIGERSVWETVERTIGALLPESAHAPTHTELDLERAARVVAVCAAAKAGVVAADPLERRGGRKVLNFGHTIGHALEAGAREGALTHGEAVILGMRAALFLSQRRGLLGRAERARCEALLDRVPVHLDPRTIDRTALMDHLRLDKKTERGRPRFVLLAGRGRPVLDCEVPERDIDDAIDLVLSG